jgi:hypothetical protein
LELTVTAIALLAGCAAAAALAVWTLAAVVWRGKRPLSDEESDVRDSR